MARPLQEGMTLRHLGRVSWGLIERLDPDGWEFVHGFDGNSALQVLPEK